MYPVLHTKGQLIGSYISIPINSAKLKRQYALTRLFSPNCQFTKSKMETKKLTQEDKEIIEDLRDYFKCEYKSLTHSQEQLVGTLDKVLGL